eukprot:TRINITY_DN4086_c0_g2_i3.p1 TRINITY_DN4086_c0_g2~~TRINITY_DN4086_c0_g2_i3.p1  ORF type:complete len:468 (-),score=54.23 TRINITY_DN4086_c0_g2_i3:351-1754(-)
MKGQGRRVVVVMVGMTVVATVVVLVMMGVMMTVAEAGECDKGRDCRGKDKAEAEAEAAATAEGECREAYGPQVLEGLGGVGSDVHLTAVVLTHYVLKSPQHLFHLVEAVFSTTPGLFAKRRRGRHCMLATALHPPNLTVAQRSFMGLLFRHAGCGSLAFVQWDPVPGLPLGPGDGAVGLKKAAHGIDTSHPNATFPSQALRETAVLKHGARVYLLGADLQTLTCMKVGGQSRSGSGSGSGSKGEGLTVVVERRSLKSGLMDRSQWVTAQEWPRLVASVESVASGCASPAIPPSPLRHMRARTLLLNRDRTRRIDTTHSSCRSLFNAPAPVPSSPSSGQDSIQPFAHLPVHDNTHICHYIDLMAHAETVILPHGYFGVSLLFAPSRLRILELYPCNYYKPAYALFRRFATFNLVQRNCSCYDYTHSFGAHLISTETCMSHLKCRSYFRSQNMRLDCHAFNGDPFSLKC